MRALWIGLLLICGLLGACRNAPAAAREDLRRDVETTRPEDKDALRARLRSLLAGSETAGPDVDPHIRASAAQGLGNLGDAADAALLLDSLAGALADENVQVRMECAIALGKLKFTGSGDERRQETIRRLRFRVAFERDEGNNLLERDAMVRTSMVNSLIDIGGRNGAAALFDIARRLAEDLDNVSGSTRADIADKGLLDRCLEGLRILTGATPREAAANRAQSDELEPHMLWWAGRVARMPEG